MKFKVINITINRTTYSARSLKVNHMKLGFFRPKIVEYQKLHMIQPIIHEQKYTIYQ